MRVSFEATIAAAAMLIEGCAVHPSAAGHVATWPAVVAPDASQLATTRDAVLRSLEADVAKRKLPSLAFGVVSKEGLVYFIGLGARDTSGAALTPDTVFRIGSITKTLTGVALLQLRDAGKLDLDDPVVKHLPELSSVHYPTSDSGPIRIRHLVTHSSGIPRMGRLDYAGGHTVTRLDLREAVEGVDLEFAPGTRMLYSNLAMALAGPIIARVSGEPYRTYVERHILAPLGMSHTVWDAEAVPKDLLAQGWIEKDGAFVGCGPHWRLGAAEAMGGLYSSVADLSRYVAFELSAWPPRDGAESLPLARSSVRESHLLAGWGRPKHEGVGVNWMLRDEPKLGYVVFHNGATEGYHAIVWMLPERGFGVIALGPAADDMDAMAHRALQTIAASVRLEPPIGAPARAALDRVVALLAAPSRTAVEAAFSPTYLDHIPIEKVMTFFEGVKADTVACSGLHVITAEPPYGAEADLVCEGRGARVKVDTDPAPPHQIRYLSITLY